METKSILERAKQYNRTHPFYINVDKGITIACRMFDAYIAGATEQDRIARAEERERCINLACEWLNDILYDGHINSGMNKQRLLEVFRKAMEGGEE